VCARLDLKLKAKQSEISYSLSSNVSLEILNILPANHQKIVTKYLFGKLWFEHTGGPRGLFICKFAYSH
jgi:hypothetical protein